MKKDYKWFKDDYKRIAHKNILYAYMLATLILVFGVLYTISGYNSIFAALQSISGVFSGVFVGKVMVYQTIDKKERELKEVKSGA